MYYEVEKRILVHANYCSREGAVTTAWAKYWSFEQKFILIGSLHNVIVTWFWYMGLSEIYSPSYVNNNMMYWILYSPIKTTRNENILHTNFISGIQNYRIWCFMMWNLSSKNPSFVGIAVQKLWACQTSPPLVTYKPVPDWFPKLREDNS